MSDDQSTTGAQGSHSQDSDEDISFSSMLTGLSLYLTKEALRMASRTSTDLLKVGRSMLQPERLDMMAEAGRTLRELREVAGLTVMELAEAIDLEDKSLLEAVEAGTATLSFELILRLASVLARHDPIPFVMRFTRTYNPSLWKLLDAWGFGRLSLQVEREREFINILRKHDRARTLSDEAYAKVLAFTNSAFELALHLAVGEDDTESRPAA